MGFSKKWTVTFTKHVKQKRKVYQDGVLELSISGDKISLYDESENLIESKFVNKSEVIESGKMLTMVAHLVDIGDSFSGGNNNPCNSNKQSTNGSTNQQNNENKKNSLHRRALHKVDIKGNKKPESGAPSNNSSNSLHSVLKEWNVLYTTQLTQKAKKYHDGTLRLSQFGSLAKQLQLYDENEMLLESKVLKKDEVVDSGRTIFMSAHLIDIGDPILKDKDKNNDKDKLPPVTNIISIDDDEGKGEKKRSFQRKPFQTASNVIKSNINEMNKNATSGGVSSPHPVMKEWDVLYTTQKTQKAKKFHDGILRLMQVGIHAKQIILISEESVVLGSRYLKSIECVESGAKCELSNYLIEVCGIKGAGCEDTNKESSSKSEALQKSKVTSNENKKVRKSPFQIASFKKNTETRNNNTRIGNNNTGIGNNNTGIGNSNTGIGNNNTGIGNNNTGIGNNNSSVKKSVQINLPNNNTYQIGHNNSSVKNSVQISLQNSNTYQNSKTSVQASLLSTEIEANKNSKSIAQVSSQKIIIDENENTKYVFTNISSDGYTNKGFSFNANQRDACQIMSILKRPMAESFGEQREPLAEKTDLPSQNIQIDLKDKDVERKYDEPCENKKFISGDVSGQMDNKSEEPSFDLFDCPSFDLGF